MAQGSTPEISRGRVSVTFGWDLLAKINAVARRDRLSFAAVVRRICQQHFDREDRG
jgi:hypothetical protein